jgi:hypothetical protein
MIIIIQMPLPQVLQAQLQLRSHLLLAQQHQLLQLAGQEQLQHLNSQLALLLLLLLPLLLVLPLLAV